MVRSSVALAALLSVAGLAQAAIPGPRSADPAVRVARNQTYFVFFEAGKAGLTPEARQILHIAAQQAHAMRKAKVRVMLPANGATSLVQNRALAVKTELMRDGVEPRSIANADQPEVAYFNLDRGIDAWLDRSAIVEILPLRNARRDGQVG